MSKKPIVPSLRIAPSLAAAPLTHLAETIAELERAGADMIHFDLEDGSFVPAVMTLGTRLIGEMRPITRLPIDAHLMVLDPEMMIPVVSGLGADLIAVHFEACPYPRRTLRQIKELDRQAGLALNPRTPLPELGYLLPHLDFVNILTTEPELPDWPYLPDMLEKVRRVATFARQHHPSLGIVVDGGMDENSIASAVEAGANTIVAGRGAFFGGGNIAESLERLRTAANLGPS